MCEVLAARTENAYRKAKVEEQRQKREAVKRRTGGR